MKEKLDYTYKVEKVNEHIFRLIGISEEYAYLVLGKKSAALIDTCCGVGNIRKTVEELTSLPYVVILTHGHVDHVGGVGLFDDKDIYLSPKDKKMANHHKSKILRKFYLSSSLKMSKKKEKAKDYAFITNKRLFTSDLIEDQTFDLGGISLVAIPLPGHTQGMTTILIKEDKILLTGDSCNPSIFLFLPGSSSVKDYKENLIKYIPKVEGKYDSILLSHCPKTCDISYPSDMIKVCDTLLRGAKPQVMRVGLFKVKIAKKIDKNTGFAIDNGPNIFYKRLK